MNKRLILCLCLFCGTLWAMGQTHITKSWKEVARHMPPEWYASDEAQQAAENVFVCQHPSGGWPKNLQMHRTITDEVMKGIKQVEHNYYPTIDNDATTTEMTFMANMYNATKQERYKQSFDKALNYLFAAQYPNGGWPQRFPLTEGYYSHITYNDNATVNVLILLRAIIQHAHPFAFASTPENMERARSAFDKGIDCILKTQIVCNGEPTVWCAQHDAQTLLPAKARAYELPSFCGEESVDIVKLLMEIDNPSPEVIRSVMGAHRWFIKSALKGIAIERREQANGRADREVINNPDAPLIWARFFDLETEQPFFCDRDGIKRSALSDIGFERRSGYGWYTDRPQWLLDNYSAWAEKWGKR